MIGNLDYQKASPTSQVFPCRFQQLLIETGNRKPVAEVILTAGDAASSRVWSFYLSLLILPSLSESLTESLSFESKSFMIVREAFTQNRLRLNHPGARNPLHNLHKPARPQSMTVLRSS
jgi:hypothetical protein